MEAIRKPETKNPNRKPEAYDPIPEAQTQNQI